MNDLMKRMGELRTSPEGIGGWARVYGSEQAHDGIDMKNASVQVGADADVGMGWKAGAPFSYTDGSSDMTAGSADHKAYGLAAYGTWLGEGGHFVDLIAKVSRLETDYGIKGTSGASKTMRSASPPNTAVTSSWRAAPLSNRRLKRPGVASWATTSSTPRA